MIVLDEFLVADHLGYLDGERAAAFVEAWLENAEVVLTRALGVRGADGARRLCHRDGQAQASL